MVRKSEEAEGGPICTRDFFWIVWGPS